jgi:hypothetical protein
LLVLATADLWGRDPAKMHPSSTSCDYAESRGCRSVLSLYLRLFGWPLTTTSFPNARHATRSLSGAQARTSVSGAGFRWAGCSQRNVQPYIRTTYSSTTACRSKRALAGVLNPCTHAAQQIGLWKPSRQEITPCWVWGISLRNPFAAVTHRRVGGEVRELEAARCPQPKAFATRSVKVR